jgi:hypothetical protein
MNRATFFEGVVVAFLTSIVGSVSYFILSSFLSEDCVLRLLISGMAIVYILYLFSRTQERIGRISVLLVWFMLMTALWVFLPTFTLFLTAHIIAIWLIRCLYFYTNLLSALADLGLNVFSIATAFWACHHTGSVFLSIWCFFLVQASFVVIPTGKKQPNPDYEAAPNNEDEFNRAYRAAEAAVSKLSSFN